MAPVASRRNTPLFSSLSGSGRDAVLTEVTGSAHLTGIHHFVLEPDDLLGTGFLLR
jgi:proline racemase